MSEEKPKRYWLLGIMIAAIVFILGMILQQNIDKKSLNSFVKKYELKDGGYLVAEESYAMVYGNGTEMERFFQSTIIPALKGNPVCFVNSNPLGGQNGTL